MAAKKTLRKTATGKSKKTTKRETVYEQKVYLLVCLLTALCLLFAIVAVWRYS